MSTETLVKRGAGQRTDATWFNMIRSILGGDFVGRISTGFAADVLSSLGSSTYRWLYAYIGALYLVNGVRQVTIESPAGMSGDYVLKLPTSLPPTDERHCLFVDSTGQLTSTGPDSTLDSTSSDTIFQVKDRGVTKAKLESLGQQVSSSSAAFSTVSTTFTDVTNLSRTITTTGRPVFVGLVPTNGDVDNSNISASTGSGGSLKFVRGSTTIGQYTIPVRTPPGSYHHVDTPAAGTYTYKVQVKGVGGNTISVGAARLLVYEYQ